MEYNKYVKEKKDLYETFIQFIEEEDEDNYNVSFTDITKIIEKNNILDNHEEYALFINLVMSIANNHHRDTKFIDKIKKIINYISPKLKLYYTDSQIFDLFKNNKLILLFLIENKTISTTKNLDFADYFYNSDNDKDNAFNYVKFFFKEIRQYLKSKKEDQITKKISSIIDQFDKYRQIGENETYIATLIRNDSINEFIQYVSKDNFPLSSKIRPSIFETNLLLIKKPPTLIEYAAFFGSIKIFQYLRFRNAEINPRVWYYAIHSKSSSLIHLLEEINVKPPKDSYYECLNESIKCHHNSISEYIMNNLINGDASELDEDRIKTIIHYHNYFEFDFENLNEKIDIECVHFYLYRYDYRSLADCYQKMKKIFEYSDLKDCYLQEYKYKYYIIFPSDRNKIVHNEFFLYRNLKMIFIPKSVQIIESYAFELCDKLEQVIFEKYSNLTKVYTCGFDDCCSMKKIVFPPSLKLIRYCNIRENGNVLVKLPGSCSDATIKGAIIIKYRKKARNGLLKPK